MSPMQDQAAAAAGTAGNAAATTDPPYEAAIVVLPARGPVPRGLRAHTLGLWWRSVRPLGCRLAAGWSAFWWLSACPVGPAPPNDVAEWALVLLSWVMVGTLDLVAQTST